VAGPCQQLTNQPYTHYHSDALHYARRVTCYGQPDIITTRMKNVQANAQASRTVHVLRSALFRLIKSYAFLFLLPRSLTACLPAATSTIRLAGFVALALHDSIYLFIYLFIYYTTTQQKKSKTRRTWRYGSTGSQDTGKGRPRTRRAFGNGLTATFWEVNRSTHAAFFFSFFFYSWTDSFGSDVGFPRWLWLLTPHQTKPNQTTACAGTDEPDYMHA
jgi:hypothetical protein